jgi:hypothetical protein
MINKNSVLKWLTFSSVLFATNSALAASIYSCDLNTKQCVAKLHEGAIGNDVSILDEKARLVAKGSIVRKKGAYGVIQLKESFKEIKQGYPVIIDNEGDNSTSEWTASFPDKNR